MNDLMLAVGDRVGFHGSGIAWIVKNVGASMHPSSKVLLTDEMAPDHERWIERGILTEAP